jgi:polysaccharide pyruvyl transferase WcaK-like protein
LNCVYFQRDYNIKKSKQRYLRILITFGVPRNTGDLALLESLCYLVEKQCPGAKIVISSDFPELVIDSNIVIDHILDYESALFLDHSRLKAFILKYLQKISWKFGFAEKLKLKAWWATSYTRLFFKSVQEADVVLLAPGGYLSSSYDLRLKLWKINKLLDYDKNVIIPGQSIGPIKIRDERNFVSTLRRLKRVIIREKISFEYLKSLGLKNLDLSTDFAMILHEKYVRHYQEKKNKSIVRIAMSVRDWNNDWVEIKEKFTTIIAYLFNLNPDLHITFLSTCQGKINYIDDSKLALEIVNQIDTRGINLTVNRDYHSPIELIKAYQNYDLYIGMRMHGGILAMLAGTPALLIGYEQKSAGVLENIGTGKYHFYYRDDVEVWKQNISSVINNYGTICQNLKEELTLKADILNSMTSIF